MRDVKSEEQTVNTQELTLITLWPVRVRTTDPLLTQFLSRSQAETVTE